MVIGTIIMLNYDDRKIELNPSYKTSSMKNVTWIEKEDSRIRWEMTADRATIPMDNKEIFLNNLHLEIQNEPRISIYGKEGHYNIAEKKVTLKDSVKLTTKDSVFITDTLNYDGKADLVSTDSTVRLTGSNLQIDGIGLTAQLKNEIVRIKKNVTAVFYR